MLAMEQFHIPQVVLWTRRAQGGYEVSSAGDKRFSALYALMPDERTLETHYQCDVKGYNPGGHDWRMGKGKPPLKPMSPQKLFYNYLHLWREWCYHHPELFDELMDTVLNGSRLLTDCFAYTPVSQARALAWLINERLAFEAQERPLGHLSLSPQP